MVLETRQANEGIPVEPRQSELGAAPWQRTLSLCRSVAFARLYRNPAKGHLSERAQRGRTLAFAMQKVEASLIASIRFMG